MSLPINVDLENVLSNPWQPRETDDPDKIRVLAESIAKNNLLQVPVGRLYRVEDHGLVMVDQVDELHNFGLLKAGLKVQLAFGHSRLAAFKYLRTHGIAGKNGSRPGQWDQIPVILQDLDDEDMFRLSVTENMARNDLNPIEVARSMERYRIEFGKTSEQIGELFGRMSDSAVRNKIRLLKLPEAVQLVLKKGELSEGSARALIPLYEVDEQIRNAAESSDELKPSEILEAAFSGVAPSRVTELVQRFVREADTSQKQPALPFELGENVPGDLPEEDALNLMQSNPEDVQDYLSRQKTISIPQLRRDLRISYADALKIIALMQGEEKLKLKDLTNGIYEVVLTAPQKHETLRDSVDDLPSAMFAENEEETPLFPLTPSVPLKGESAPKQVAAPEPKKEPVVAVEKKNEVPLSWDESTVTISLTYCPVDGDPAGRMVMLGARLNSDAPLMEVCREVNLVLPAVLQNLYYKLAGVQ